MEISKDGDNYKVESSTKGKFYTVDVDKPTCSCAHFLYRMRPIGGECKHIKAVRKKIGNRRGKDIEKIIEEVKQRGEAPSNELIEKYGEKMVDLLISKGEVYEEDGRIRVLK